MEKQQSIRRQYNREFKREAVRLAASKGVAQTARDLGVNENLLWRWKQKIERQEEAALAGVDESDQEELTRLRREVDVLRQEREILKKAVGIFSQLPR